MKRSIATVCLSGDLEEKLAAGSRAGFDGVEIFENDLIGSPRSPRTIASIASDLGLSIDLYQPFRDFEGVEPELLERNLRRARAKFEVMRELGTDTVLFCSNVGTATRGDDELIADQLRRCADIAAENGMRIAYEALAWGKFVSDFEHAYRIVELADHPALGTCLDSFHILSRGWDSEPIERLDPAKIFFVQLADAPGLSMDVLSWSRHHRVFPGEGIWDLAGFMGHLVQSGYDGPVSLEVFNDTFRQSPVDRTAVDGMRSLIWLENQTTRLLDERGAPTPAMTLNRLPDTTPPTGIDFTEVQAGEVNDVETILHHLGFHFGGRHRRKPVRLWHQGGARVVINNRIIHNDNPGVTALGFTMPDPGGAVERARRLTATPVPRQTSPDEIVLAGFEAPDSTELFICPSEGDGAPSWTSEFGDGEPETAGDDLVTHVDHVNLAQPWQHFDEGVLFYESAMSLRAEKSQDVAAPFGLIRSQVMRTDDGAVRLPLNLAPERPQGGPVEGSTLPQHIAFATSDIVALATRARSSGLEFLPIPRNYYDDVAARLQIDPELLETIQDLNLLYDRDEFGSFLHFYTRTVGSVFFEIVQRIDGYDGYGAGNAPVRMAAQYERDRSAD